MLRTAKKVSVTVTVGLVCLAGLRVAAARQDFARYEIILQRMPFGALPVAPAAAAATQPLPDLSKTPPPDSFIKNLRLCAIEDKPEGLRIGLVDLTAKPPKSYFLYIGDMEDGVELVEADYTEEKAKLRKGSEEYWISMRAEGAGGGSSAPAAAAAPAAPGIAMAAMVAGGDAATRRLSYAERLRARREAEEARLKELSARPKLTPEEMEKSLQQFQMDVIRRGDPPLPIPLTPDMDDQLVKEGVLPPIDQ